LGEAAVLLSAALLVLFQVLPGLSQPRHARRLIVRLQRTWPWAAELAAAFTRAGAAAALLTPRRCQHCTQPAAPAWLACQQRPTTTASTSQQNWLRPYSEAAPPSRRGHIGYHVVPAHRRRGHATQMLVQAKTACRELGLANLQCNCNSLR
jgi:RimJ/RimL family protein N-acetyltransferase